MKVIAIKITKNQFICLNTLIFSLYITKRYWSFDKTNLSNSNVALETAFWFSCVLAVQFTIITRLKVQSVSC